MDKHLINELQRITLEVSVITDNDDLIIMEYIKNPLLIKDKQFKIIIKAITYDNLYYLDKKFKKK